MIHTRLNSSHDQVRTLSNSLEDSPFQAHRFCAQVIAEMNFPIYHVRSFSSPCLGFLNFPLGRLAHPILALIGSLVLAPLASAKAPDGVYKFTSGSAKLEIGGQSFDLTRARIKEIGSVQSGSVTIKNGKITLDRDAARNIFKDVLEIKPEILAIKGPLTISFNKSGNSYSAKTPKPVVANLSADVSGEELASTMRSRFDAKVTGGKLIINVKIDGTVGFVGSIDQREIEGSATIVCNR